MVIRSGRIAALASRSQADDRRQRQVRAAETRLLYENASTGTAATFVIAVVVAYGHWDRGSRVLVGGWLAYMLLVSAARFVVARLYWRLEASEAEGGGWNTALVVCVASAAAGWCGAAPAALEDLLAAIAQPAPEARDLRPQEQSYPLNEGSER